MIITLTGPNSFAIAQAARQLTNAFAAKHGANSIERVDAETLDAAHLPDLLQGVTLFAPSRLVFLSGVSANKTLHEPLASLLPHASSDITLVIADPTLDKRTKLYKWLKTNSTFKDLPLLGEPQLAKWVQQQVSERGGSIDHAIAATLVNRVGGDQWQLQNEIIKLVDYNPAVTTKSIELLVAPNPQASAFELLDAALAGSSQKTTALLAQLAVNEDPYRLFGLLASQVHALTTVASAGTHTVDDIAKATGMHPFVVRKTQPIAKRLQKTQLAAMAEAVATCDAQLKSTGADPWHIVALALGKIIAHTKKPAI